MKKKIFNIVCTLLICIFAFVAFAVLIGGAQNRTVFLGNKAVLWVATGSMKDTIPEKSYILIEKISDPGTEIAEGEIITFRSDDSAIKGKLNTHRVYSIDHENGRFITKGDNNPVIDDVPVPFDNVVGRYVKSLPVLTAFGRFLMTPVGFAVTMILVFALVCVLYLPDLIRSLKKKPDNTVESGSEIDRLVAEEVERLKEQDRQNRLLSAQSQNSSGKQQDATEDDVTPTSSEDAKSDNSEK